MPRGRAAVGALLAAATLTAAVRAVPFADAASVRPQSVAPVGAEAFPNEQATDRQGDTAFFYRVVGGDMYLRVRRDDGSLTSPRLVRASSGAALTCFHVAVDARGDGLALWLERPAGVVPGVLYGRWFSRTGRLGPLTVIAPASHDVVDGQVVVRDPRHAVVSWAEDGAHGSVPFARVVTRSGVRGPVLKLGRGPRSGAPLMAVDRAGSTRFVWSDTYVLARRLSPTGRLSRLHVVYRDGRGITDVSVDDLGLDGRGVVSAAGIAWVPARYSPTGLAARGVVLRISPRLHLAGRVRPFTPKHQSLDGVRIAVAHDGVAVLGWQHNSVEGAWLRRLGPNDRLGVATRVSTGSLGEIALDGHGDGVAASTDLAPQGDSIRNRVIRVTRIRDGRPLRTRSVARSDYDVIYLDAGLTPAARGIVTYEEPIARRIMVVTGR